jgi:hypothetical protein
VKFKKGELVRLSDFGKLIHGDRLCSVGIVLSEPYDLLTPLGAKQTSYYEAYDLLVGDEVIKGIPTEFLYRMMNNEEPDEEVEEMVKRDSTD